MVTIGTDPEFFLYKDNLPIPAIGLLGGTKGKAVELGKGVGIQEDNVMGELTVPAVSLNNPTMLYDYIQYGVEKVKQMFHTPHECRFVPSTKFTSLQLSHPKAQEFGCSRDWNVYDTSHCSVPNLPENTRFAGGHIHFGHEFLKIRKNVRKFVKILDLHLAVPAITKDNDTLRRKAYGKPGNFRYKPYGMEYRTLSNFWVNDEQTIKWVFGQVEKALQFYNDNKKIDPQDQTLIFNSVQQSQFEPKLLEKYNVSF